MPIIRTARMLLCLSGALVWLAAATAAAGAQDGGCVAGASHDQIQQQLAKVKAQARAAGCPGFRGLFRPHGACAGIQGQVKGLEMQLRQARRQQQPRVSNFLFQNPFQERVVVPDCARPAMRSPRVVCVRLCDGYYFPVNHSIKQKNLAKDEQKCLGQYPEGQAALYIDRSGGENIAAMVSLDGKQKYGDQPFAFAFQQRFDPACPRPGAHLADAARATARDAAGSAVAMPVAINAEMVSAAPETVRLVGPPYAYYFPERGSDVAASVSDASSTPHRDAAAVVRDQIEKAYAAPASLSLVRDDEQALVAGD